MFPTIEAGYFLDEHFFFLTCHKVKKMFCFAQPSYKIMSKTTPLVIDFLKAETDFWTALFRNILTKVSRRHLTKGADAAPGSESQALQARSSPAHGAATKSHLVSTLEGNAPMTGPPDSGPVHTG